MGDDQLLRRFMGVADTDKRCYKFEEGEVDRAEFEYCRVIDQIVFGEKGYVETLGPTWELVHDPRFLKLEECFIQKRQAVFGGDARHGRTYVDGESFLASTVHDLEQYSELVGEGRHFRKAVVDRGLDPQTFKDADENAIWMLINEECPNYFDQRGKPNKLAQTWFQLIKMDIVGMIDDYAQEAHVDQFVDLDTLQIVSNADEPGVDRSEKPVVYIEIDILEKALTMRCQLRATAYRVLKQIGMSQHLTKEDYLTDMECDQMLRMIYQSNWPDDKPLLMTNLLNFMQTAQQVPYADRLQKERQLAAINCREIAEKLRTGEIPRINEFTEPTAEIADDKDAAIVDQILHDPLKADLFQQAVAKEKERPDMWEKVKHVFEDPDFVLTEDLFIEYSTMLNDGVLPEDMQRHDIDSPLWDLPPIDPPPSALPN